MRITDDAGREVPLGGEGEVCGRTPLAIQGYYQNPHATDEFLQGGWCHTGDIGFQFCKESLAAYKAPKVVEFLLTLPRTGLGKIDRVKLGSVDPAT